MIATELEFTFKAMPVGYFEDSEYPRRDGRYRYVPYRGPGHYELRSEMRDKGRALCHFNVGSAQVSFVVLECPEHGVLELADFVAEVKDDA